MQKRFIVNVLLILCTLSYAACSKSGGEEQQELPTASFDLTVDNTQLGKVKTTNKSSGAVRYKWLVDGTLYTEQTAPEILFLANREYTVSLIAISVDGHEDVVTRTITISHAGFFRTRVEGNTFWDYEATETYIQKTTNFNVITAKSTAGTFTITLPAKLKTGDIIAPCLSNTNLDYYQQYCDGFGAKFATSTDQYASTAMNYNQKFIITKVDEKEVRGTFILYRLGNALGRFYTFDRGEFAVAFK